MTVVSDRPVPSAQPSVLQDDAYGVNLTLSGDLEVQGDTLLAKLNVGAALGTGAGQVLASGLGAFTGDLTVHSLAQGHGLWGVDYAIGGSGSTIFGLERGAANVVNVYGYGGFAFWSVSGGYGQIATLTTLGKLTTAGAMQAQTAFYVAPSGLGAASYNLGAEGGAIDGVWSRDTYANVTLAAGGINTLRLISAGGGIAIDPAGLVRVRTDTSQTYHTSYGAFQLGISAAIMFGVAGTDYTLYLQNNAYYDGSWRYRVGGGTGNALLGLAAAAVSLYLSPGGSAGDAFTPAQYWTLTTTEMRSYVRVRSDSYFYRYAVGAGQAILLADDGATPIYQVSREADNEIRQYGYGFWTWYTAGSGELMRLSNLGKLTTAGSLEPKEYVYLATGATGGATYYFGAEGSGHGGGLSISPYGHITLFAGGAYDLSLVTDGGGIVIDTSGNVVLSNGYLGIGGSAGTNLHVIGDTGQDAGLWIDSDAGTWAYMHLKSGATWWDVGMKSNDAGGALQFRYLGVETARFAVDGTLVTLGGLDIYKLLTRHNTADGGIVLQADDGGTVFYQVTRESSSARHYAYGSHQFSTYAGGSSDKVYIGTTTGWAGAAHMGIWDDHGHLMLNTTPHIPYQSGYGGAGIRLASDASVTHVWDMGLFGDVWYVKRDNVAFLTVANTGKLTVAGDFTAGYHTTGTGSVTANNSTWTTLISGAASVAGFLSLYRPSGTDIAGTFTWVYQTIALLAGSFAQTGEPSAYNVSLRFNGNDIEIKLGASRPATEVYRFAYQVVA